MEFTKLIKERKRMCDFYEDDCTGCPMKGLKENPFQFCISLITLKPEQTEMIVEKWSAENPENPTQKLLSEFRDNIFRNFENEMEIRRHSTYGGLIDGFSMYAIRRIINTELERMLKK